MLDDAAWLALTAVLTVLGALWTVRQGRRHGSAAAVRGVAITLLPAALLLTGTLRLGTRIVDAVIDWATSPGVQPAAVVRRRPGRPVGGAVRRLGGDGGPTRSRSRTRRPTRREVPRKKRDALPPSDQPTKGGPVLDDDLADIEAILKKRGIT